MASASQHKQLPKLAQVGCISNVPLQKRLLHVSFLFEHLDCRVKTHSASG